MTEHDIQNRIRLAISEAKSGVVFRANVGQAWTGSHYEWLNRDILIHSARPFNTGLPTGFSDLFGVTPEGQAFFLEVKSPKGKPSPEQLQFLEVMRSWNAITGVVQSQEAALNLLRRF